MTEVCDQLYVVGKLLEGEGYLGEAVCVYEAAEAIKKLEADNAKLRELVRDAWGNGNADKSCEDCEITGECLLEQGKSWKRCLFETRVEERMQELGIEVSH